LFGDDVQYSGCPARYWAASPPGIFSKRLSQLSLGFPKGFLKLL
jgi:hypothetical protein